MMKSEFESRFGRKVTDNQWDKIHNLYANRTESMDEFVEKFKSQNRMEDILRWELEDVKRDSDEIKGRIVDFYKINKERMDALNKISRRDIMEEGELNQRRHLVSIIKTLFGDKICLPS